MKLKIILTFCLCFALWGCQGQFGEKFLWSSQKESGTGETEQKTVRAAVLLPLSGKSAKVGEAFQNSAMMALQEQSQSPMELMFFDTLGTAEGASTAWKNAKGQRPDVVIGPIFADEVRALKDESPSVPVLSFTTDSTLMEESVYSMGVLIPSQIERLVQFMCEAGQKKIGVLGPEDKTGELTMNVLSETVQRCPGIEVVKVSLYEPNTTNFTPAVLKMVPKQIDPKKGELTEEEELELAKPMAERLAFDSLFIFEDGIKLQQLISLLAYYDVTPAVVPFYGLANWQSVKERALTGGYFTATPMDRAQKFNVRYQSTFGQVPPRISSLAYDAVSLVAFLAERGRFDTMSLIQDEGFNGVNGRFRLRSNGTNERLLEVFQFKTGRRFEQVSPVPEAFMDPDTSFKVPAPVVEEVPAAVEEPGVE